MSFFKRLTAVVAAAALLGPMLPLEARTKKGDRFLAEGRIHEAKKEWDAALESYEKALSEDPADVSYQMATEKARFQTAQKHVENGLQIRSTGQLGEALLEFQKAYAINPGSIIAIQELRVTQNMIERERKRAEETGKEAPPEERALTPAEAAKKETEDKINRILPVPELKPSNTKPIDLKMNNQPVKVLFDTLGKYAGINVLWDSDYQNPPPEKNKLSIEIEDSTIEQALDYLAVQTKSFWKPLSPNTIFVTNDNLNKRRDYEDQVLRIFYPSNVTTPQEINDMITTVRTTADCTKMYPYNSQFAIVAKCSADQMTLAEKIIHDLDKPKPEVVVDILVLEASSVFSRQITAALASTGLNVPANFSPRASIQVQNPSSSSSSSSSTSSSTTTTTSTTTGTTGTTTPASSTPATSIPLAALGHLSSADYAITLPSALLQATLSDTGTKVLQAPQLRSVDNVKATLKIGDREPTASGSFQPGIGGVGINPLVNTQFQYIDVGVNVELTPRVHDNGDISMEISLDISSVNGTVNLGGLDQPIIGQRKVTHSIRLREGQVSLLAGLVQSQETKSLTGIPGLSSIPLLGRLFTGNSVNRNRDELMIALIPHIVRAPVITEENLRAVSVGNQQTTELHFAPKRRPAPEPEKEAPAAPEAKAEAAAKPPANTSGAAQRPAAPPTIAPPAVAPPATAPPATAPPATAPSATAPPATAPPATAPPATAPPATAPPATAPPATAPPATAPPATAPPATAPPATTPPATAPTAPGQPPKPAARASILVAPPQVSTNLSGVFTLQVMLDGGSDIVSAPMQVQFDPRSVKLNNVTLGNLFTKNGQQPLFTRNILNDAGTAAIQLSLMPGTPGAAGPGALVSLVFQAVGRGSSVVTFSGLSVTNSQSEVVASGSPQVIVDVK